MSYVATNQAGSLVLPNGSVPGVAAGVPGVAGVAGVPTIVPSPNVVVPNPPTLFAPIGFLLVIFLVVTGMAALLFSNFLLPSICREIIPLPVSKSTTTTTTTNPILRAPVSYVPSTIGVV